MHDSIFANLFVLELANNHWGELERGLRIIDTYAGVVRRNGVRAAIKLQFRDVESFVHPDFRDRRDLRYVNKTLDTFMPWEHHRQMVAAVRGAGMVAMATPFDEISVDKCVEFGVEIIKIASSDVQDRRLRERIAATGKPVIASSGGASLEDLDEMVAFFRQRKIPFALNHCVSHYPCEDQDLELNQIDFLRHRYPDIVIGFSSHEYRSWEPSLFIAYAKGARTFERHVDIDHQGVKVSPYCSLPEQVERWFKAFHTAREMCGQEGGKRIPSRKEVRYLDALVRGLYAARDLPAGHRLGEADVRLSIPLLKGQLSTREFSGQEVLKRPVSAGEPIALELVDAPYSADAGLARLIAQRGLDPTPPGELPDGGRVP